MTRKYVIVTGAAGFIGSRLTETLMSAGKSVIAVDTFLDELYPARIKMQRWERLKKFDSNYIKLVKFDLRHDGYEIFDEYEIESIFNQAALPGLLTDPKFFSLYYECNLIALNKLLEFARQRDILKFIHASTSSVYGKSATGSESVELRPISPYGVSKLAAEKLVLAYQDTFGVPSVILRYFSVYGPGQRPDMAYSKLINAALTGDKFHIYGDGLQRRSNTYIDDVVSATIKAAESKITGEIFNVCGDETLSLLDVIRGIESNLGVKIDLQYSKARTGDQRDTSGVNSKIKSMLGWSTSTNFETGIQAQIESIRLN